MTWNTSKLTHLAGIVGQKLFKIYTTSKNVGKGVYDSCASSGKLNVINLYVKARVFVTKNLLESPGVASKISIISMYIKRRAIFTLSSWEDSKASSSLIRLVGNMYIGCRRFFTYTVFELESITAKPLGIIHLCVDGGAFKFRDVIEPESISNTSSKVVNLCVYSRESLEE